MTTPTGTVTTHLIVAPAAPAADELLEAARLDAERSAVRRERGSLDDFDLPVPVLTQEQARAERNLQAAIRTEYDEGVAVPCLTDPATWDADFTTDSVTRADVFRAAQLCRTACPVFARCATYLATEPPVCGIVAGRYIKHWSEIRTARPYANRRDDWATGRDLAPSTAETTLATTADAA